MLSVRDKKRIMVDFQLQAESNRMRTQDWDIAGASDDNMSVTSDIDIDVVLSDDDELDLGSWWETCYAAPSFPDPTPDAHAAPAFDSSCQSPSENNFCGQSVIAQAHSCPQPRPAMLPCNDSRSHGEKTPFRMTRKRHPGKEGDFEITNLAPDKILVQFERATGATGEAKKVIMTLGRGRWGGQVWTGPKGKGRCCRVCYTFYHKDSYNDIEENCPACFLRLYDLKNKCQIAIQCRHGDMFGATAAVTTTVATEAPVAATRDSPQPNTTAIQPVVDYLNVRYHEYLDVLYVYDNFSRFKFLRKGTERPTARRVIGIVEYRNGQDQLAWGVIKKFSVGGEDIFDYDGRQPLDSSERCHRDASGSHECQYFSSTWDPRPHAILAAVTLSGFRADINGVYMFAGWRPSLRKGGGKKANRRQGNPYYQSAKTDYRLFATRGGVWNVCSDGRVLASTTNSKAKWVPTNSGLDGSWALRSCELLDGQRGWAVPDLVPTDLQHIQPASKCRPISADDEYTLKGTDLDAITEMKTLHALGVAMGSLRIFNCKDLQWNPKAGKHDNRLMQTNLVCLQLPDGDWRSNMLCSRVQDLILVTIDGPEDKRRLQAAGAAIQVFHPNGTPLGKATVHEQDCPNKRMVLLRLSNSDIPTRKRACVEAYGHTRMKRPRV